MFGEATGFSALSRHESNNEADGEVTVVGNKLQLQL